MSDSAETVSAITTDHLGKGGSVTGRQDDQPVVSHTDDAALTPVRRGSRDRRLELEAAVGELERTLSREGPGWMPAVARQLRVVRAALQLHVQATEGERGLFEEVLDRSPRLTFMTGQLRRQHLDISEIIDRVVRSLDHGGQQAAPKEGEVGATAEGRLAGTREEVRALLARFDAHRDLGDDLIHEAYDVDIGGGE